MPDQPPAQPVEQPPVQIDEMQSKYENEEFVMTQDDVPAVAALFNQVGSALTKVDSQQLEGQSAQRAMKLDKDRVIPVELQPGSRPGTQHRAVVPSHIAPQHVPVSAPPPTTSHVTLGVKDYDKIAKLEKKVTTLQRKLTTTEKTLTTIKDSLELPKTLPKYKIVSDDVECVTSNTQTLLTLLYKELANKPVNITISKC